MRTITSGAGVPPPESPLRSLPSGVPPPESLRSLCLGLWTRGCWGLPKGIGSNSVHQHEPDLEHHREKRVRATESGYLGHLCVRYMRLSIMTDAVSPSSQALRRTYASKSLFGTLGISTLDSSGEQIGSVENLYANQEAK